VSPPPNWSPKGRATKDLSIGQIRAPQSASEVHRHKAWQPVPGIGHPLSLHFSPRRGALTHPPLAYGSCRSYGKRVNRVSHSSLDGRPSGAAHRLHRPGDERHGRTGRGDRRLEQTKISSNEG
jgi:hypothetical protein